MKEFILNSYLSCYHFVAKKRIAQGDLPERFIHAHLVSVLSTAILMWAYAILACFTMSTPVPGIVGIIASLVHLLSPLLYWKNNKYFFNSSVFIATGLVHQMTFAFYNGGFDSNILTWLGILPMLAGVIAGRKAAIMWAMFTAFCVLIFLTLKLHGFIFPNLITPTGVLIAQGLILFGWIFISSLVIWVHVLLVEQNANELMKSRERTQNIVNILSHDVSTPLSVIVLKLKELGRTDLSEAQVSMTNKIKRSADRLVQITESIQELRLNELRKKEITFIDIDVREMVIELKEIFSEKLENKSLRLNWSVASEVSIFKSSRSLLLNQILGNLLSNSIKFSQPQSEIRLRISRVGDNVQMIIEDSGTGIPKDMRADVFEASISHSSLGTQGEQGSGFGLPIVKNCVERLNGTIAFESQTANEGPPGTRFKLLFPV
jgi:signal transduction histidine kinase